MVLGEVFALLGAIRPPAAVPPAGVVAMVMGIFATLAIPMLLVSVVYIASMWKMFDKAGEPGWYALIPILNILTMLKIAGKPAVWILILFIPCVGPLAFKILVDLALAERFGQSSGFAIGLILLPIVFLPMLAFGSAQYKPA
jgi:hypothetical protein